METSLKFQAPLPFKLAFSAMVPRANSATAAPISTWRTSPITAEGSGRPGMTGKGTAMSFHRQSTTRHLAASALAALLAFGSAGQALATTTCVGIGTERLVVELLFGRNVGTKVGVTERAFQRFVDREVTPRFPDGFTLLDTTGQFRAPRQRMIVREPGKQLVIALGQEQRDWPLVGEIVTAYKSRFNQHSVAVIAHRSCVSF